MTLGVILPTDKYLIFKTYLPERIEIISRKCNVQIGDESEPRNFVSGQSFNVPKNSYFRIIVNEINDYICHLG